MIPDPDLTLNEGAIAPWAGGNVSDYFRRLIEALCDEVGIDMDTPWGKLPAKARKILLHGHDTEVRVRYRNRYGRTRTYDTVYEGVIPYVSRRHEESESDTVRERLEGYMREVPCHACAGSRLKPLSLAVTVAGRSIAELAAMPIGELTVLLQSLTLGQRDAAIAARVLR